MESHGEDLVIRIKQFEEYIMLSKAQRTLFKKDDKGRTLKDEYGNKIIANPRTAGQPKWKKISGQDMYSGMNKYTRSKMIGEIKRYLYENFRGATYIEEYPIQIELFVKHTPTVYKINRKTNTWHNTNMNWDLDNFSLIWRKAAADALCGNVEYVKKLNDEGKRKYEPDRRKWPAIIKDDNTIYLQRWIETYKEVKTPEERELIFIISKFDTNLYYYDKL